MHDEGGGLRGVRGERHHRERPVGDRRLHGGHLVHDPYLLVPAERGGQFGEAGGLVGVRGAFEHHAVTDAPSRGLFLRVVPSLEPAVGFPVTSAHTSVATPSWNWRATAG